MNAITYQKIFTDFCKKIDNNYFSFNREIYSDYNKTVERHTDFLLEFKRKGFEEPFTRIHEVYHNLPKGFGLNDDSSVELTLLNSDKTYSTESEIVAFFNEIEVIQRNLFNNTTSILAFERILTDISLSSKSGDALKLRFKFYDREIIGSNSSSIIEKIKSKMKVISSDAVFFENDNDIIIIQDLLRNLVTLEYKEKIYITEEEIKIAIQAIFMGWSRDK